MPLSYCSYGQSCEMFNEVLVDSIERVIDMLSSFISGMRMSSVFSHATNVLGHTLKERGIVATRTS